MTHLNSEYLFFPKMTTEIGPSENNPSLKIEATLKQLYNRIYIWNNIRLVSIAEKWTK